VVIFGTSTQYLLAGKDDTGAHLDGGANYTLNVPANVPVKQFWSVVVYDLADAGFVENTPKAGVTSLDEGLKANSDGSTTIYLQAKSPGKDKESNWLPTPDAPFYMLFRMYLPEIEALNGQYELPGIAKAK